MDLFDPNLLLADSLLSAPVRIPLNDAGTLFATVDGDLAPFFLQWVWVAHVDQKGMVYAARQTQTRDGYFIERKRIYMHREVLRVTRRRKPSKDHILADHKNGDTLLNTRLNLRWATRSMNRKNIHRVRYGDILCP